MSEAVLSQSSVGTHHPHVHHHHHHLPSITHHRTIFTSHPILSHISATNGAISTPPPKPTRIRTNPHHVLSQLDSNSNSSTPQQLQQVIITTTTMTTLTRKIADFEAEFRELSATATASPRINRRQMDTPSSSTKSLQEAEDPNNNHKTATVEFHSDGDMVKEAVETEPAPQMKTTFNVLNVSNGNLSKVHRPPVSASPVTSVASAPNPSLKRISATSSSSNSSINATTPTSGSARHLEKLTEESESVLLPEGIVDDEDNSDTDSEQGEAAATRENSKVSSQVTTKVQLTNNSSSEDLLETEDSDGQCSEEQEQLETEKEDEIAEAVPAVADKGPSFEERLKLAQPIWYLPHINRATVVHYLQEKTVGVFIVRQSSKPQTLALSVRLPHGRGPHVEHYLVEKRSTSKSNTIFRLEGSEHFFSSILNLVVHYSNCCDELPVRLGLPAVLRTSTSDRNQLSSLALLGQEFWQSKFVQLQKLPKNSLKTETLAKVGTAEVTESLESSKPPPVEPAKPRLPPRRQPSSCSNSTEQSNSSHSAASPVPLPRKKVSSGSPADPRRPQSPMIASGSATKVTPPPLPPKSTSPELSQILESPPKIVSSPVQREQQPALPPRRAEPPPPIPPRTREGKLQEQCKVFPPPRPSAGPKRGSPSTLAKLNDLLSPTSMTESEIGELVRCSVPGEGRPLPSPAALAAAKANYYNQTSGCSAAAPATTVPLSSSPLAPQPSQSSVQPPTSTSPTMCEVYTQTEATPQKKGPVLTPEMADLAPARPSSNLSSSTYYMDPIDALVVINGIRNSLALQEAANQMPQQKRHSDPELTSQKDLISGETPRLGSNPNSLGQSLESLLENFKNRYPSCSSTTGQSLKPVEVEVTETTTTTTTTKVFETADEPSGRVRPSVKPDAGFSTVDSAWQWHDCTRNALTGACASRNCPKTGKQDQNHKRISIANSIRSDVTTIEDIISTQAPECVVPKVTHIESLTTPHGVNCTGVYDNLTQEEIMQLKHLTGNASFRSSKSDAATEFSDPWNKDMVESMILSEFGSAAAVVGSGNTDFELETRDSVSLDATAQLLNTDLINFNSYLLNQEELFSDRNSQDYDNVAEDEEYEEYQPSVSHPSRYCSAIKRDDSEATLKHVEAGETASADSDKSVMLGIVNNISTYVFELASSKDNTFAKSIDNFIECTKESTESSPTVILGYIRQFMNGMKNYLIKHGEGEFISIVKSERARLKSNQFLNIDSILECALQKLIIKPLKNFIYEICIRAYNANGSLKILSHNIKLAQNKSPEELGIRAELLPIEPKLMAEIQQNLRRLQQSYSPIKKLEHLLQCISLLNASFKEKMKLCASKAKSPVYSRSFSGDDMLPLLLYIIVHCGVISIEIEIEYMLGLLHSSILNGGDGNYYLTVWSSAIQVLKNMYSMNDPAVKRQLDDVISTSSSFLELQTHSNGRLRQEKDSPAPSSKIQIANSQAYMKIMIPNELTSSITCKTVPVRANMTAKDVCRMIAHTYRITNPEDYALYQIKDLEEIQFTDGDFPQLIMSEMTSKGEQAMFAYKRVDAKFIWPTALPGSNSQL